MRRIDPTDCFLLTSGKPCLWFEQTLPPSLPLVCPPGTEIQVRAGECMYKLHDPNPPPTLAYPPGEKPSPVEQVHVHTLYNFAPNAQKFLARPGCGHEQAACSCVLSDGSQVKGLVTQCAFAEEIWNTQYARQHLVTRQSKVKSGKSFNVNKSNFLPSDIWANLKVSHLHTQYTSLGHPLTWNIYIMINLVWKNIAFYVFKPNNINYSTDKKSFKSKHAKTFGEQLTSRGAFRPYDSSSR